MLYRGFRSFLLRVFCYPACLRRVAVHCLAGVRQGCPAWLLGRADPLTCAAGQYLVEGARGADCVLFCG